MSLVELVEIIVFSIETTANSEPALQSFKRSVGHRLMMQCNILMFEMPVYGQMRR